MLLELLCVSDIITVIFLFNEILKKNNEANVFERIYTAFANMYTITE